MPSPVAPPASLKDTVLSGLDLSGALAGSAVPAPVDELQRTAMARGSVEWLARPSPDRQI